MSFLALVYLSSHARKGPAPGKWHVIVKVKPFDGDATIVHCCARLYTLDENALPLGRAQLAEVRLLAPESYDFFPPGTEFELWEGKRVGGGQVRGFVT